MGIDLALALGACLFAAAALAGCAMLSRTSAPASVNRTARSVQDLAEDVEARVKACERRTVECEEFLASRLEEMSVLAETAKKRLRGARRSEQAQQQYDGADGGLPPVGHPDRMAALERRFR